MQLKKSLSSRVTKSKPTVAVPESWSDHGVTAVDFSQMPQRDRFRWAASQRLYSTMDDPYDHFSIR
jgi:hypothetical protein